MVGNPEICRACEGDRRGEYRCLGTSREASGWDTASILPDSRSFLCMLWGMSVIIMPLEVRKPEDLQGI